MRTIAAAGDRLEPFDLPPAPSSSLSAYFRWDHERLGMLFHRAVERTLAERWASARADWWLYREALKRHFRLEEELIFPVVERGRGASGLRITVPLRIQHRETPALVGELERAFAAKDRGRVLELAADLALMLVGHEQLEEERVYGACHALLDVDREAELLGRALDPSSEAVAPVARKGEKRWSLD